MYMYQLTFDCRKMVYIYLSVERVLISGTCTYWWNAYLLVERVLISGPRTY